MALPDYAAISTATALVLTHTDYSPSANNAIDAGAVQTDQLNLTSLAADGWRQSTKIDFGATWDLEMILAAAIEFATAPVVGETVDFYLSYSHSATAAVGNAAAATGADAAYTGTAGSTAAATAKQAVYIGSMVLTLDATTVIQIDTAVGTFVPRARYASLLVHNNSSDAVHSDSVETAIAITPLRTSIVD